MGMKEILIQVDVALNVMMINIVTMFLKDVANLLNQKNKSPNKKITVYYYIIENNFIKYLFKFFINP